LILAQVVLGAWRGQVVSIAHHGCETACHHADLHHHDHDDGHHGVHSHDDAPMHLHMPDHDVRLAVMGALIAPLAPCEVHCALPDCSDVPQSLGVKGGSRSRGLSDDVAIPGSPLEALNVIRLLV
jgi:hypothetical protein